MNNELHALHTEAVEAISKAYSLEVVEELRIEFLGRNGKLTKFLKELKDVPENERKERGAAANHIKNSLEEAIEHKKQELQKESLSSVYDKEWIDVTLPGASAPHGAFHLVTRTVNEIVETFHRIGFTRYSAPEVDTEYYAFEALNMPAEHPARDDWETFFLDVPPMKKEGRVLLSPHTSNMQVRAMKEYGAPLRLTHIGRVYRRQSDPSHVPMFHQVELLAVSQRATVTELKGVIEYFLSAFFGPDRKLRFRPYHFRFTEPSFEVDIDCDVCRGDATLGCRMCKQGWLELGGAGMTHPEVLKAGGINPDTHTGFAFGFGVERITMMRQGLRIPDMRILYENDLRFLKQF